MPLAPTIKSSAAPLCLAILLASLASAVAIDFHPADSMPGHDLFSGGQVCQIQIALDAAGFASLRADPREFVRAEIREGQASYTNVALRVKGNVGSFQEIDQKPDLTLDFTYFGATQTFHGLRRIHLNNSVEDPTYCHELLGSELFRAAGIPAPRVAHAVITLNGRRLGLYVLKEGSTEDFLSCFFKQVCGNLYEPGEGHDVNQRLKRNAIAAPRQGRAALQQLARAALETNAATRWDALQKTLDIREFVDFMAMEIMLDHRDGYSMACNNYRVYFDLDSDRFVFLPQGMDLLFGRPNATWRPSLAGLVARAVMGTSQGAQLYESRFGILLTNLFRAAALQTRVDQTLAALRPALTGQEFSDIRREAGLLKERIARRQISLQCQLSQPAPQPLVFTNGIAALSNWTKSDESSAAQLDICQIGPTQALRILALSDSGASWRAEAFLPRGRYRFEARAKVSGVEPLPFGRHQGAGLRVAGQDQQVAGLVGDSGWRDLAAEFEVKDDTAQVELVCELRAARGQACFALDSLKLAQIP